MLCHRPSNDPLRPLEMPSSALATALLRALSTALSTVLSIDGIHQEFFTRLGVHRVTSRPSFPILQVSKPGILDQCERREGEEAIFP
jgi:hypothetical protein